MNKDNHLGRVRDNSYDKEQFYDEWYDQTEETKSELLDCFDCDIEHKDKKEVNIDNFYNGD